MQNPHRVYPLFFLQHLMEILRKARLDSQMLEFFPPQASIGIVSCLVCGGCGALVWVLPALPDT